MYIHDQAPLDSLGLRVLSRTRWRYMSKKKKTMYIYIYTHMDIHICIYLILHLWTVSDCESRVESVGATAGYVDHRQH